MDRFCLHVQSARARAGMGFVPAEPIISALEILADERRAYERATLASAQDGPEVIEAYKANRDKAEPRSVSHWGMWA